MHKVLTAAARSRPGPPPPPPPPRGFGAAGRAAAAPGLGALGTGGFPGGFGAPGLAPTGGGAGFGFVATGGGGLPPPTELLGRELAGLSWVAAGFFHGVADPLDGAIPGNTETGFAEASAAIALTVGFGTVAGVGLVAAGAAGAEGGRRRLGGGGGAAGAFGFGGTNSR